MPIRRVQLPEKKKQILYWQSECGRVSVFVGDCCEVMANMEPNQFHAIVTDPPYGLEFMGKDWDAPWKDGTDARNRRASEMDDPVKAKYLRHNVEYIRDPLMFQVWFELRMKAALYVAKPGAHLLSFGGTRMWHRAACAIEDAGFEIRDCIMWLYLTGFPKGLDVSKAIDKLHGVEREVTGTVQSKAAFTNMEEISDVDAKLRSGVRMDNPVTEDAARWNGWNTALKPGWEPVIVARKGLDGSVAQNILEHECGAMNIDACRIGTTGTDVDKHVLPVKSSGSGIYGFNRVGDESRSKNGELLKQQKDGRHPANVIHDGSSNTDALRYFYSAKAGDSDRPHGRLNTHPTVKPIDLMRYLVRLVCAVDKKVLDPFMGSGSTGCAAILEGMQFVGIEQNEKYADIAVGKLKLALQEFNLRGVSK